MPRRPKDTAAAAEETRIENHVAARIRLRRGLLGMSQTDLAKALGLTFQQVQKYERGSNRVSVGKLYRLCTVLDVPMSFFFDGIDDAHAGSPRVAMSDDASGGRAVLGRRELDLLRCWRAADTRIADQVLALLRRTTGMEDGGGDDDGPAASEPMPATTTRPTVSEAVAAPKRRGRPPGSGNKAKAPATAGNRAWSPKDIR